MGHRSNLPPLRRKQVLLEKKNAEEFNNRYALWCYIEMLHEYTFWNAVEITKDAFYDGSTDSDLKIHNAFDLYRFVQELRDHLAKPGTDLNLEKGWKWSKFVRLRPDDLLKELPSDAKKLITDKKIKI